MQLHDSYYHIQGLSQIHEVYCAPARDRGFTSEPKYLDTPDSHILDVAVYPNTKKQECTKMLQRKIERKQK